MSKSIGQDLVFHMFVSFPRRLPRVEDAVNVMLDTSTAWFLPVALHFSISAADAGIGRSAGQACGKGSCSRHDLDCSSQLTRIDEESEQLIMVAPLSLHLDLAVNSP